MHWLLHILGLDTQNSIFYNFWSGIGTQLAVLIAAVGAWHKHNCHAKRCPRIGKHILDGTPYCTKHHPRR